MSEEPLREKLRQLSASRAQRDSLANDIMNNPQEIRHIFSFIALDDPRISPKASWILEIIAINRLELIISNLNELLNIIATVRAIKSMRSLAKTCYLLVMAHYDLTASSKKNFLSEEQRETITGFAFDVLMGNYDIAPKAHCMKILQGLGRESSWIYPDLESILVAEYPAQSKGYQACARNVLMKIRRS